MSSLAQGDFANIVLSPGEAYTISTGGTATVQSLYGAPAGTTTLTNEAVSFGPYGANAKLRLTAVSGPASYSLARMAAIAYNTATGQITDPDALTALAAAPANADAATRSLLEFVGAYSPTADHTEAIRTAQLAAAADGFDLTVPALTFNYEDLIPSCSRSIRGQGIGASVFVHQGTNGENARWAYTGDDIEVSGISFRVANTPLAALNDATEPDGILNFNTCARLGVRDCEFVNCYGTAVLVRHCEDFDLLRLRGVNLRKDGFHITGASKNGRRAYCTVLSGGDDSFPIVGYLTGTGAGQPDNITDSFNIARGSKFARGFGYVGAKNVRNYGCIADGLMPSGFATQAPDTKNYRMLSGLYIASESAFGTYGNENIQVDGVQVKNCGYTSDFSGAVLNAVHIVGRSGQTTRNIKVDVEVENVGTRGIFVNGGVTGGVENIRLTGRVKNTNDPNAWFGAAGAGAANGVEIQNTKDITVDLDVAETGSNGVVLTSTCTGSADIKVRSSGINTSGTAGADIVNVAASSVLSNIKVKVKIVSQATVSTAATPYLLDRIIECNNPGKVRGLEVEDDASLNKKVVTGVADQAITVTASPFTWTNPHPIPVNARVIGGTVSSIARGQTTGVAVPVYAVVPSKTQGYVFLQPGESVVVTYSGAPTMDYAPSSF